MIRKWLSFIILFSIASVLFAATSCGDPQELVSITVQPGTETFGASNVQVSSLKGAQVQLTATGTYLHPPVNKDITDQVTWFSNTPQMVTVNSSGLITVVGGPCGATLISATVQTNADASGVSSQGAIVSGYMTANVTCYTGTTGGGGTAEPAITVTFGGSGTGTIASSPLGLSCASTSGTCSGTFPTGTDVTLTATPVSGAFGGWSGCSLVSGDTCTINNLSGNTAVTATFN
jgi:Bacterial Ig-like domain (group 2)